jgi:hypothetical protein
MHIEEAKKKWCPMTFAAGEAGIQMCCTTNCMAWVPYGIRETKDRAYDEAADDGWKTHGGLEQYRYVPDPENGYCDMMPKGVE